MDNDRLKALVDETEAAIIGWKDLFHQNPEISLREEHTSGKIVEIIEELEENRRGLYGGATGYLDFGGDMDLCITIRTMVKKGSRVYLQAGAGIVADSRPEMEYQECCNKVMALAKTLVEKENL